MNAAPARASRHDLVTVSALTVIAGALATFLHEYAGHGGFCVLTGGRMRLVTSVNFDCSAETRWMMAGGTLVNAAVFAGAWLWLRHPPRSPGLRMLLWIVMALNGLDAAGYFFYSGVAGIGDWANLIAGWHPAWALRLGLTLLGIALYWGVLAAMVRELRPFLPPRSPERVRAGRALMLTVYFTFGVLSVCAGLFNPVGMRLVAISAAAASFGGGSGLAWGWQFLRGDAPDPRTALGLEVGRSYTAIVGAAAVAAVFIGILGPGIKLS